MRILIVGPSWVGDMVMAQTLFQCLRQRHPECVIDVLAPEWSRPILERMPEVRQALSFPLGHGVMDVATRRRIGRGLRGQYEQAILLPNSLKSALVPWFAGIPKRTGWRGEMRYGLLNDIRKLDKQRYPLMIERFMALAFEPGVELPKPYPQPRLPWTWAPTVSTSVWPRPISTAKSASSNGWARRSNWPPASTRSAISAKRPPSAASTACAASPSSSAACPRVPYAWSRPTPCARRATAAISSVVRKRFSAIPWKSSPAARKPA